MGANGSKAVKRVTSFLSSSSSDYNSETTENAAYGLSPFVLTRKGSMYIDEDGDIAHEFYVEVPSRNPHHKSSMRRVMNNLKPQGLVAHEFPRLSADINVIICEA